MQAIQRGNLARAASTKAEKPGAPTRFPARRIAAAQTPWSAHSLGNAHANLPRDQPEDEDLREFALSLNKFWAQLGRATSAEAATSVLACGCIVGYVNVQRTPAVTVVFATRLNGTLSAAR